MAFKDAGGREMVRGTIFSTIGVALEALKGERAVSDLAVAFAVGPKMIHKWQQAVLAGAAGIFEPGGKSVAAGIDGGRFVTCMQDRGTGRRQRFLSRKLEPWAGKCGGV